MQVAVYSISNNFIQPDASARAQELADLKRGVDVALKLGTDILRVFSGSAREGVSQAQGLDWILEGLSAGAAYAASQGRHPGAGESRQIRRAQRSSARHHRRGRLAGLCASISIRATSCPSARDPTEAAEDLADLVVLMAHLKDMRRAVGDEASHVFADPDGTTADRVRDR